MLVAFDDRGTADRYARYDHEWGKQTPTFKVVIYGDSNGPWDTSYYLADVDDYRLIELRKEGRLLTPPDFSDHDLIKLNVDFQYYDSEVDE